MITQHCSNSYPKRININHRSNTGITALFFASQKGHRHTVKYLLRNGADLNICTVEGFSPLHTSCELGHIEVVKALLPHNANPFHCSNRVDNAFVVALRKHNVNMLLLLMLNCALSRKFILLDVIKFVSMVLAFCTNRYIIQTYTDYRNSN